MKKVMLIAACLLSITAVNAQEQTTPPTAATTKTPATPEQRAQKHVDALNSEVALTDDQKTKVYDLAMTKVKKVDEAKASYKTSKNVEERDKAIRTAKKEFRDNTQALLTPDQLTKLKATQKNKKAAGKTPSMDAE